MFSMTHKFDSILDAMLKCEAGFMPSRNGEKWGYIDEFDHELGTSKCIFETDEDGSFFQMTIINEEVREDNVPELLEVINIMNGVQDQLRFYYNVKSGMIHAKREFIVQGRRTKEVEELVSERYQRMKDIFDDLLWAFDWKMKVNGPFDEMFAGLGNRSAKRKQKRDRDDRDDFDPAYA